MFGGKIKRKEGKPVPGSYRQHAWSDTCEMAYPIVFEGELTVEVQNAAVAAWNGHRVSRATSGWGQLRWSGGERALRVDVATRSLITESVTRLCD